MGGSGAIFFCGCNLRCIFCQNCDISTVQNIIHGEKVDKYSLSEIMLKLQQNGAENINFVTPTPHIILIAESIAIAKTNGLKIPVAYNTNSYVTVDSLKLLDGLIDIYIPDLKYVTPTIAKNISGAENYPQYAKKAIEEMIHQCGTLALNENNIAKKGVIIRHLVLPGNIDETRRVLTYIKENYPQDINVSLMAQYFPAHKALEIMPFNRPLLTREYNRAVDYAISLNFDNLMIQKLNSSDSKYVPEWGKFI